MRRAYEETTLVKISVFTHDGQAMFGGITPDSLIEARLEPNVVYVQRTWRTISQRRYQARREILVKKQPHAL